MATTLQTRVQLFQLRERLDTYLLYRNFEPVVKRPPTLSAFLLDQEIKDGQSRNLFQHAIWYASTEKDDSKTACAYIAFSTTEGQRFCRQLKPPYPNKVFLVIDGERANFPVPEEVELSLVPLSLLMDPPHCSSQLPTTVPLTNFDEAAFCKRELIRSLDQLPAILSTDVRARFFNWRPRQVVCATTPLSDAPTYYYVLPPDQAVRGKHSLGDGDDGDLDMEDGGDASKHRGGACGKKKRGRQGGDVEDEMDDEDDGNEGEEEDEDDDEEENGSKRRKLMEMGGEEEEVVDDVEDDGLVDDDMEEEDEADEEEDVMMAE